MTDETVYRAALRRWLGTRGSDEELALLEGLRAELSRVRGRLLRRGQLAEAARVEREAGLLDEVARKLR